MEKHTTETLTNCPDHLASTASSPSLSRRSTDSSQSQRRGSKMGHIMDSIREALAQEQERLFSESSHHHQHEPGIMEDSEHTHRQDEIKHMRVQEKRLWETEEALQESISPAIEARPSTWGWPGLGTYPEAAKHPIVVQRLSKNDKAAVLEPRFEAATMEAIDNAAESELFGWSGLGVWSSGKK